MARHAGARTIRAVTAVSPDCVKLTADVVRNLSWLPVTCAYRLVAKGQDLPDWHPLVSGSPDSVHEAGVSVRGRVSVSETALAPEFWAGPDRQMAEPEAARSGGEAAGRLRATRRGRLAAISSIERLWA